MIVSKDQRKLLTWTLNAGGLAYETDLELYGNKIYALGVHEIQVERTGECYIRRDIPSGYDNTYPNYGTYRYGADTNPADGIPDKKIDRAYAWDKTRSFWKAIEKGMRRWKHIRHYLSFILFGAGRVIPVLANQNGEQDKLIEEIGKTLDFIGISVNYPNDPDNFKYIKGIEIDFEASLSGGSYDQLTGLNTQYINILKRIKNEICIPRGLIMQVNAYSMWGKETPFYYRFHDYELFASSTDQNGNSLIDELQIMTYDFAWNGSAPGASTPIWWFNNVATWANKCFTAPGAKLTIDKVFFGSAGYGHRWGIYDDRYTYGATIIYRQFIDWQNGLYKHSHSEGDTQVWHNQEYLTFAGIEDQESKNEVLQQHIYDYFKARYANISQYSLADTATLSSYNNLEYITTYSRIQQSEFTNIKAEALAPSIAPVIRYKLDSHGGIVIGEDGSPIVDTTSKIKPYNAIIDGITIKENGVASLRQGVKGYRLYGSNWLPYQDPSTGAMSCKLDENGKVTYTLNMPNAGDYLLIALVSFPWYSQSKLGGTFNGSPLTIQAPTDYYPLYLKASHWFNCGTKTFNAGANTIVLNGDAGQDGTAVFGFIVCEAFKNGFSGGEITFKANVKPFKKKDGTLASVPAKLAVTTKALRQKASPLMMWEDDFRIHRRNSDGTYSDRADLTDPNFSAYYQKYENREFKGGGSTLSGDLTYCYNPDNRYYDIGYSTGVWAVKADPLPGETEADSTYAYYNNLSGSGKLLVNYNYGSNYQVELEFRAIQEGAVGIAFGGSASGDEVWDGYVFAIDYKTKKVRLSQNGVTLQEETLAPSYALGDKTKLRVISHNGRGYFYVGYGEVESFKGILVNLSNAKGGVSGAYANVVEARVYKLRICTTDKWELMEKFTVKTNINGQATSKTFGAVSRTGYTFDPDFGYLNYSGIYEAGIRDPIPSDPTDPDSEMVREDISLDYEFFITEIPGFEGDGDITIKLDDPGIWVGLLYIVDREGGSITWCGDSYSFNSSMNSAVNEYGAKGIGLWVMGQEDPRAFETIPEVVPWTKAPPGL